MSGAPLPGLDDPGADQLPHFSEQLPPAGMPSVCYVLICYIILWNH
jgi:hypothetical protein